jgi:hypothetical protein
MELQLVEFYARPICSTITKCHIFLAPFKTLKISNLL